ncbi:MAG: FGGY-family carbohydrate kinase [Pirellulales bacterium]|nr:FGGY-family carbohydrate kinase [Pirellulales bacterium]
MYLGVDLGTTNVKAVVVDEHGATLGTGSAPVERFPAPDGGVEQDLDQIWEGLRTAIRSATRELAVRSLRAIGVSSQGGALQLFDADDHPLGPVISWLDRRGQPYDAELTAELGSDFFARRIGHGGSGLAIGQILRLCRQSPAALAPPRRLGFVGDAIVGRLCGRRAHDATSLGIALLYNPWQGAADRDLLARLGLREDQLPCLLPATVAAGALHGPAAEALGLPEGISVSPAIHDQYAASLGAASVERGDVNFGAGTAWVLLANTEKLAPPCVKEGFVCSHPVEGLYGQMISLRNGGSAIEWAMSLLGEKSFGVERLDAACAAVPPGSEGLRFWPFLAGCPNADGFNPGGGRLDGITFSHSRDHLVRAVIEGLACELLRHIRLLVDAGFPVCRLTMCGSAAASRLTPQIIADIANLPLSCVKTSDVGAFGAAMIARKLVEPRVGLAEIARLWAPPCRRVLPGEGKSAYNGLLRDYFAGFDRSAA